MAHHVWEAFKWRQRNALPPPRLLLEDYQDLCSDFVRREAEESACDFQIPKLIQAIFYAMVVNDALELGILTRNMAQVLKIALTDLYWYSFEM